MVRVTTRRGTVELAARQDDAVPDGVVFIPFAYVEAAANLLTNPKLDPFGKIPEFKFCAAKVEAVDPASRDRGGVGSAIGMPEREVRESACPRSKQRSALASPALGFLSMRTLIVLLRLPAVLGGAQRRRAPPPAIDHRRMIAENSDEAVFDRLAGARRRRFRKCAGCQSPIGLDLGRLRARGRHRHLRQARPCRAPMSSPSSATPIAERRPASGDDCAGAKFEPLRLTAWTFKAISSSSARARPGLSAALSAADAGARAARRCRSTSRCSKRRRRRRPAATPAGRRPTCGWRRPSASSRASCTTCWRRPASRATRPISRGSPPTRPRRSRGSGAHGVEFHQPTYYLAKGPPRIQPVGGGPAIIETLTRAAKRGGRHDPLFVRRCRRSSPTTTARMRGVGSRGRWRAAASRRCGGARLRRLPGQRRDDARAFRSGRRRRCR